MKTFVRKPIAQNWAKLVGLAVLCAASAGQAQFVSTVLTNLYSPSAVASDPNGNIYITESGSNCIVKFVPTTGASSVFVGAPGQSGTNNGLGGLARFNNPIGIAYDSVLNGLIVVDQGNQELRLVSLTGYVSSLAGEPGVIGPAVAGPIPAASATFSFPTEVAVDNSGANVFVSDSGNNAIRLFNAANLTVSTLAIGNGYTFKYPEGLSLDDNGNLWIADTKNDVIVVVSNAVAGGTLSASIVAGSKGLGGSTDDPNNAANARFNYPSDVHWDDALNGLLVADTGNDTIRNVFMTNGSWAVQTVSGTAGSSGYQDGVPAAALFDQPVQISSDVYDAGLYIVDKANNSLRAYQPAPPEPQVSAPSFGFVTFPLTGSPPSPASLFTGTSNAVLNNFSPPLIAVEDEPGTETYITSGPTPADPFDNTIPIPGPNTGTTPEVYQGDGLPFNQSAPSVIQPLPDITIYAVSYAPGRRPSPIVSARFQFVCANPVIGGVNAASVPVTDATTNSLMYYTLNGSVPDDSGQNPASVGPIVSGQVLSFNITSNTVLNMRAFRDGFAPSGVSTVALTLGNVENNQVTLGFPTGEEGSSEFKGTAGQRFYAPITLTLLPGAIMYSLQFNVTVTNLAAAAVSGAGYQYEFDTMLKRPDPSDSSIYFPIEAAMFSGGGFTNGLFTNLPENLLGVGWLERAGETNLYNSKNQNLITYSEAKDTLFLGAAGKVIVGGYSFVIPPNASLGSQYQIQIGRPSATADGVGVVAAPLIAPTNGSLASGSINAIKNVTVLQGGVQSNQLSYLVGDVNNFHWFNVGDFGDGNLDNSDVEEVFQSAVYLLNSPAPGSDMFDAMDSANSSNPEIFTGDDATANALIDNMLGGDGQLNIADVYVTFRRSLDPSLLWVRRYWGPGGALVAVPVANNPSPAIRAVTPPAIPASPLKTSVTQPHTISIGLDQVVASTSTVVVPLRVLAADPNGLPIRDMMFDLQVQALDGSPILTEPVVFTAGSSLGAPTLSEAQGASDFAGLWLSTNSTGFAGTGVMGTLTFSLPTGVTTNSAYLISLQNFSASPNGLGVFAATVQNGLVTLSDRGASSWGDGIPDSWRLLHFGTISSPASAASADPDGDGASNWQEYIAGTDPLNAASVFKLQATPNAGSAFSLQWQSVAGKSYTLQSAASPTSSAWTTITTMSGTGASMSWSDTSGSTQAKFYRATVQ